MIQNKQKILLIIFLLVTNLLLSLYIFLTKSPQTTSEGILSIPADISVSDPPTDPTQNWQTYKNEKYGFEFKYPSNLVLSQSDNEDKIRSRDYHTKSTELGTEETIVGISYSVRVLSGRCEFYDENRIKHDPAIRNTQDVSLDGVNGKKYHISWDGADYWTTRVHYNDSCIHVDVSHGPDYDNLWENQYNQMLSTFKFTN